MSDIQHNILEKNGEYVLQISVPASKVEDAFNLAAKNIAATANIPGFRPGAAPLGMVRQHYASHLKEQVSARLVKEATRDALSKSGVSAGARPVVMPQFRPSGLKKWIGAFEIGGAFTFGISFKIPPELHDINLNCIAVDAEHHNPEEIVAEQLHHLRHDLVIKTPSKLPATELDEIVCSISATGDDGVPIEELNIQNFPMSLDLQKEGLMSAGIANALLGKVPGDIAAFSEEGIHYKIAIHQVNNKSLPDLDDNLAQKCGVPSINELKEKIYEEWYARNAAKIRRELHLKIRSQLVDGNPFDVPQEWIEEYTEKVRGLVQNPGALLEQETEFARIYAASDYLLELLELKYKDQMRLSDADLVSYAKEELGTSGVKPEDYIRVMIARGQYDSWVLQQKKTKILDWLLLKSKENHKPDKG